MERYYQEALDGTLTAVGNEHPKIEAIIKIKNHLPTTIRTFCPDWTTGRQHPFVGDIDAGGTLTLHPDNSDIGNNTFCIFRCVITGGLVAVILFSQPTLIGAQMSDPGDDYPTITYEIGQASLVLPNDIGPYPAATASRPIPSDSGRVVVGCGKVTVWTEGEVPIPQERTIVREQYWRRLGTSYSVAPGETRTLSVSRTTGMSQSSTKSDTLAESVGISASGGLGPASASISASINASSTSFQEISLHEETTTFEQFEVTNTDPETHTYISWQLTDIITVANGAHLPIASAVSGQAPVLISGPFTVTKMLEAQRT